MAEQRKFIRLDSSISVRYHINKNQTKNPVTTVTKNISAGGLRIIVKERMPIGSSIDISLQMPNETHIIPIVGEVVWTIENKDRSFDVGIKYIDVNPQDIQKITDYVLKCLGQRLVEAQNRIAMSKKAMMFLYKEIRMPGDKSPEIKAPDFLVEEVNLPGDKVRYAKISSSLALKYKIIGHENKIESASLSQYVSGRGIWFLADKEIPSGSSLELRLELPDSGIPVIAIGIVTSCKSQTRLDDVKQSIYYEIGVQYKNISVPDRKRIIRYVYSCKTDYMMIGKVPPAGWLRCDDI